MSSHHPMRLCVLLLALGLMVGSAMADGAFQYLRYYNISGGYQDLSVSFVNPRALYVDDSGLLYVSDYGSSAVWVLNANDTAVDRIPSGRSEVLTRPANLVKSGSVVYIADESKGQVVAYLGSSSYLDLGPATSARRRPMAVYIDNQTMWILEASLSQVVGYNLGTGRSTDTFFGQGLGVNQLNEPKDLVGDGSHYYIADSGNNRIQVYGKDWTYQDTLGTGRSGVSLSNPSSVALADGRLYVADTNNHRVVVMGSDGYLLGTLSVGQNGTALDAPLSVRVHGNTLYVLDGTAAKVYAYSMNWSGNRPQVIADLDALNRSIGQHQIQILEPMDRLNLSHATFTAPDTLRSAQLLAQSGSYLEAASKLASARAELEAVRAQQIQALRAELQKRVDGVWAIVSPYSSVSLNSELKYKFALTQNQIQAAQEQINAANYVSATTQVLALQTDAAALRTSIDAYLRAQNTTSGSTVVPNATSTSPTQSALLAQGALLRSRLALAQIRQSELGISQSLDAYSMLIDSGLALADAGVYDEANSTLSAAAAKMDELEAQLDDQASLGSQSSSVSQTLNTVWTRVNASTLAWQAAGIDSSALSTRLSQARDLLATDPASALRIAQEVNETAKLNDAQVQGRSSALGWVGLFIGAVALVAIGAWMLFRHRPNRPRSSGLRGSGGLGD